VLRRNRRYDEEFLSKILLLRDSLVKARELVQMCKEREKLKRNSLILNIVGNRNMNIYIDFENQKAEIIGGPPSLALYEEDFKAIVNSVKDRLETPKEPQPQLPKIHEPPISVENGNIVCNYEFACILSYIAQKAPKPV